MHFVFLLLFISVALLVMLRDPDLEFCFCLLHEGCGALSKCWLRRLLEHPWRGGQEEARWPTTGGGMPGLLCRI